MTKASGIQWNSRWAVLLALMLVLISDAVRAAPDAAWAFDLLARAEQQQPTGPLDFLPGVAEGSARSLSPATARIQAGYGRLPTHFEPNLGQTAEEVKFVARGPGYTLFLTADEAVLALCQGQRSSDRGHRHHPPRSPEPALAQPEEATPSGAVVRMRLEGATRNAEPQLEGLEKLPGISNYFIGNDPAKWCTHVPHYRQVKYQGVYPGIDLVFYGNPRQLEYDFVLAPGADPNAIRLAFEGVEEMWVADNGDLILRVAGGELVLQAPKVYQEVDGERRELAGRYVLRAGEREQLAFAPNPEMPDVLVGFQVASYQPDRPLVIDPVLVYSTYLGGSGADTGWGIAEDGFDIAVDGSGNAYVTGITRSTDFPKVNAKYPNLRGPGDAFIFKLSSDGQTVRYSTYLGGSSDDGGVGIAVDESGNAYVTGYTQSTDFPRVNAKYPNLWGGSDAFIFKLSSDGQTVRYSTYLGGSSTIDVGYSIAVDGAGDAYVTGETSSTDFPKVNAKYPNLWGGSDAFIFKLSSDGQTVRYSTYLGGSSRDRGRDIAVDGSGNAYVTGWTESIDFPKVNAKYPNLRGSDDAFIFKLSSDGQTVRYSTYLGGSSYECGLGIAVDGSGNAYVTGLTASTDFPKVNAKYPNYRGVEDAFIFKLSSDGQTVRYSTYLGGNSGDGGGGIALDGSDNAYVMGYTFSADFPTVNAIYSNWRGHYDAFVFKLSSDGQTVNYSTYLGGSSTEYGNGIAVDRSSNAYVVGTTWSANFPTVNAKYPNLRGTTDAFITKISSSGSTLANHFAFSSIASPQQVNVPFAMTLTYRNPSNQVINYNGQATLASNLGRASPNTVTLTNGVWQGNVSMDEAGTGVYLSASAQGETGTSNTFTVNGAGSALGSLYVSVENNREQPIAAANVYLDKNNDGVKDFSQVTDGTGHAAFYDLPAGQYTLWATKTAAVHSPLDFPEFDGAG